MVLSTDIVMQAIAALLENSNPKVRAAALGTMLCLMSGVVAASYPAQPIAKGCGGSPVLLRDLLFNPELMRNGDAWVIDEHFWNLSEVRPEHKGMQIRNVPKKEHRDEYYPLWEEVAGDTMRCTEALMTAYLDRTPDWAVSIYPHQLDARIEKAQAIQLYLQRYEEKWRVEL